VVVGCGRERDCVGSVAPPRSFVVVAEYFACSVVSAAPGRTTVYPMSPRIAFKHARRVGECSHASMHLLIYLSITIHHYVGALARGTQHLERASRVPHLVICGRHPLLVLMTWIQCLLIHRLKAHLRAASFRLLPISHLCPPRTSPFSIPPHARPASLPLSQPRLGTLTSPSTSPQS
jgi:hypothetical protein